TVPHNTKEQKGISGDSLCQQRVTGAHQTRPSEPPNSNATYLSRTNIHNLNTPKNEKKPTPQGEIDIDGDPIFPQRTSCSVTNCFKHHHRIL
ncbi:MAG: hypothetical protein WCF45_03030, partial [Photobacterium halotolerans]